MAMAKTVKGHHHILTLVIEKPTDIPMVRGKIKLLARSIGCSRKRVARFATAASEMARLLLNCCHGGKVRLSFLRPREKRVDTFLEFVFHSTGACGAEELGQAAPCIGGGELFFKQPFPALKRVFEDVELEGGIGAVPLTVSCRSILSDLPGTENLLARISAIRKELFADTEESYMENLRAKHDEVLRLLREKTEQNRLLDQSNNELLQLSNDLEALAQERTIIEMSLKIADQVRNPATVIGGLARQLIKKGQFSDKMATKMEQIVNQAEHIDQIVHRFHAMADERRNLFAQEDLVRLVKDGLQSCPILAMRAITPVLEVEEQPVFIHANRRVLKVAFIHILRRAANATPTGGQVSIGVYSDKESAYVTIVDQGGGFADAALRNQPDEDRVQAGQPGLTLVRQILLEHQAGLELENSAGPGQGGRLVMRFPLIWREQGKTFEVMNGADS